MAFRDACSEIKGTIPTLPYPLAQKLVNRAWKEIRDMRLWSWLLGTADILSAKVITAGTVTATPGQNTIVLDGTAAAALQAVGLSDPPLAGDLGKARQIRVGNTGSSGPLYTITAFDGANTITLDRNYQDPTGVAQGAGLPYQVYKAYYSPPDADFLRYVTVTNMRAGYTIRGKKLYYSQARLNAIDAQRGGTGDAYIIAAYKDDPNGRPVHEWYPHPVNAAIYNCVYQKRGQDLSDTVDLPTSFMDPPLISLAMIHGCTWAAANVSTHPELAQTNWIMLKQDLKGEFKDQLLQAIKQDDEINPLLPVLQGSYFDFPLGGQFLQGHDVSSLIGDAS